jgi:hypothetical protein
MSANRGNAAARNRRAGGADMPPPQQNNVRPGQRPGQQAQAQAQASQNPKISVSDAIGLVSLRIGRLEQFMYKINHEGLPSDESDLNLGENDRIIDEDVFRSIVSRIEALEQRVQTATSSNNNGPSLSADHPVIKEIVNKQQQQQLSIYEVKDMILKMQSFAMETSTSLKGLIEQYETDKVYYAQENSDGFLESHNVDFAVESEVVDDNNLTIDGNILKELVKQELSNESV